MSQNVGVRELLEAGSHFGHQVSRWNPKMRPYIFASKGGIHILDLQQTVNQLKTACDFVTKVTALGGSVLFVATKRQAQAIVQEEAKRAGQFFVTTRWLGGMLTNFRTIRASIDRLKSMRESMKTESFAKRKKKERLQIEKEVLKLESVLSGIQDMPGVPSVVFVIDPNRETIAVNEARKLKIPLVALVDTNCNPDPIDYVVAANDDAVRSIQIIAQAVADAALEGVSRRQTALGSEPAVKGVQEESAPVVGGEHDVKGKGKAYIGGRKGVIEGASKEDLEQFASVNVQKE